MKTEEKTYNTENDDYLVTTTMSCEISWSSTGRSLTNAAAAVKLYQTAVELGALIESMCGSEAIDEKRTLSCNESWKKTKEKAAAAK